MAAEYRGIFLGNLAHRSRSSAENAERIYSMAIQSRWTSAFLARYRAH